MKSVGAIILPVPVGILFAAGDAGAQEMKEKSVKGQIFGVWAVVSVVNDVDGKKTEPYGANPKGQFIFTADGYFSTNIVRPDRPSSLPTTAPLGPQRKTKRRCREAIAASAPTKSVPMDQ